MKTYLKSISAVVLVAASVLPVFASAATSAGVTPGSFWYFFDTASEKIALFFTFNPEAKAKKALEYADERLAEIDAIAGDKNPDAVKAAIADYEGNVALATEKSKEVKDKGQAESLLNSIESGASRNQEALSAVLIKVPEEAKAAIAQAIEASKKGQEEAAKQITELKGEVEKLKQEVAELKQAKDADQSSEVEKLKKEVESLKQRQAQQLKSTETKVVEKVVEKIVEAPRATPMQPSTTAQPPIPATPVKGSQVEVKIGEQPLTLINDIGKSFTFESPSINRQEIQKLVDAGFLVTKGSLPEGIVTPAERIKAEEKMRMEEENKRIEAQILVAQQCVQSKKAIVAEYNTKKLDLEQQITNRKAKYYADDKALTESFRGRGVTASGVQGFYDNLLRIANRDLDLLNLELDKLYVEYSGKLNQFQC